MQWFDEMAGHIREASRRMEIMDHFEELGWERPERIAVLCQVRMFDEDGELVSVKDRETLVTVQKKGGSLEVNVNDGGTKVFAKLPLKLAERVVASSGDGRISPREAMAALDGTMSGKIVDVQDGDTHVKVWVW